MKSQLFILALGLLHSVSGACWWTGCQPNNWAVKGCTHHNMRTVETKPCNGGQLYHCCDGAQGSGPKPAPAPGPSGVQISFNEFSSAVTSNGYRAPSQSQYNSFMSHMRNGQISTKQEAAMALTHIIHESGGLIHKREIACAQTGCPGAYPFKDCDVPGRYYYGRGYIQLTWCYNYKAASQDLYGDARRLVDNPDLVADDDNIAWATTFWFWGKNVHNKGGASGQFGATTNAINGEKECKGGPNALANKRFEMYGKVRAAFGLSGAGDAGGCWR